MFRRLVKELGLNYSTMITRFEKGGIDMLQKLAENFLTVTFAYSSLVAVHTHRDSVMPKDMILVKKVRADTKAGGVKGQGAEERHYEDDHIFDA